MIMHFVIGVSGVGKTTTLRHLEKLLPKNRFEVHDIDENGVPENVSYEWRIDQINYWINRAQKLYPAKQLILVGVVEPKDVNLTNLSIEDAYFYLLDANEKTIEERISKRHNDIKSKDDLYRVSGLCVDEFVLDNIEFSKLLRESIKDIPHSFTFNTSLLSEKEVGNKLSKLISDSR